MDWIYKKIEQLKPYYNQISNVKPYIFFQTQGGWCLLKLAVLMNYVDTYTLIIRQKMPHLVDKMIFIDLLAGSGITYVKSCNFYLPGSSIIAAATPRRPEYQFDNIITIDHNPVSCNTLRLRLEQFKMAQRHIALEGEVNTKIDDVIPHLPGRTHYLAFVDNQGFNASWNTIQKLLDYRGDIFINFPTSSMGRVWGNAKKGKPKHRMIMNRFFGNHVWEQAKSREDLLKIYVKKIEEYKGLYSPNRDITRVIPVFGGQKFNNRKYDLVFATIRTKSGSKWVRSLDRLIERAQTLQNILIDDLIMIYKGDQKTLNGYYKTK